MRNSIRDKVIVALLWLLIWCCFNKIVEVLGLTSSNSMLAHVVEGLFCILIAQVMCSSKGIRWLVLGMLTILLISQFNIVSFISYLINIALFWLTWQMGPIRRVKPAKIRKKIKLAKGHILR
jgi:hypothetical protein